MKFYSWDHPFLAFAVDFQDFNSSSFKVITTLSPFLVISEDFTIIFIQVVFFKSADLSIDCRFLVWLVRSKNFKASNQIKRISSLNFLWLDTNNGICFSMSTSLISTIFDYRNLLRFCLPYGISLWIWPAVTKNELFCCIVIGDLVLITNSIFPRFFSVLVSI